MCLGGESATRKSHSRSNVVHVDVIPMDVRTIVDEMKMYLWNDRAREELLCIKFPGE